MVTTPKWLVYYCFTNINITICDPCCGLWTYSFCRHAKAQLRSHGHIIPAPLHGTSGWTKALKLNASRRPGDFSATSLDPTGKESKHWNVVFLNHFWGANEGLGWFSFWEWIEKILNHLPLADKRCTPKTLTCCVFGNGNMWRSATIPNPWVPTKADYHTW